MDGTGARYPSCQTPSTAVHGSYVQRPSDLPAAGRVVQLELRLRRFCCRNPEFSRRTFAERPVRLLAAHARRTRRLATVQCAAASFTLTGSAPRPAVRGDQGLVASVGLRKVKVATAVKLPRSIARHEHGLARASPRTDMVCATTTDHEREEEGYTPGTRIGMDREWNWLSRILVGNGRT
ncbi:transposase family protein [Corallococcus terminator]